MGSHRSTKQNDWIQRVSSLEQVPVEPHFSQTLVSSPYGLRDMRWLPAHCDQHFERHTSVTAALGAMGDLRKESRRQSFFEEFNKDVHKPHVGILLQPLQVADHHTGTRERTGLGHVAQ
jgi:hypothetical protein